MPNAAALGARAARPSVLGSPSKRRATKPFHHGNGPVYGDGCNYDGSV